MFPLSVPVNIQANPTLGMLTHMAIQPPMPSPVPNAAIEMLTFQFWIYGYVTNKNKFAKSVRHKYQWIVQDGHDCGMLIPDVTMPIVGNFLYPIHWTFSKRAMIWSASTVKMDKQATACATIFPPPPLHMMTCGQPISAPTGASYIAFLNNVYVGMTCTDFIAGALKVVLSIAIDLVFNWIGKKLGPAADDVAERTTREILTDVVVPQLTGKFGWQELAKSGVSGLAGLLTSSLTGDPTFKVGYGLSPIVGGEVSVTGTDEGVQATLQGEVVGLQGDTSGKCSVWGETSSANDEGGQS